jgi:hypothetical protein
MSHVRWVPCHHGMARPQVPDGGDDLQFWRAAANILNKQPISYCWRQALSDSRPAFSFSAEHLRLQSLCNILSDERVGLSVTIAAGPRQCSHSLILAPYFTLSDLRLPQPGGPGSRVYIPQEHGGPVIPPGTGFPVRRLLRVAGLEPASERDHRKHRSFSQLTFTRGTCCLSRTCYPSSGLGTWFRLRGNVLPSRCLVMDVSCGPTIPTCGCHVTI